MPLTLENIGGASCEPVSGTAVDMYYGLHSEFSSIEDPKDLCGLTPASTLTELIEIPAAPGHIMTTGKQLFKIKAVLETGAVKTTMIGEKGRRLFQNEATLEVSGSNAELLGFLRFVKNQSLLFFVEEFGSGQIRQLGSKRLAAWVEGLEHAIEAAVEGKNSVTITIMDKQKWPAAIYKGALQLTPAV